MDDAPHIRTENPEVSVIVVNTNEEVVLRQCIESLLRHEASLSKEILIVDNGSRRDPASALAGLEQAVRILYLGNNVGFCRANNAGIRQATGRYVLLLNPDVIFTHDAITICLRQLHHHPQRNRIAAIGCRLLDANGHLQKSFYWSAASVLNALVTNALIIWLFGNQIKMRKEEHDEQLHRTTSFVPWLCGAFLLMPHDILKKEQFYLDEDFFLYSDDVELGARIRRKGYRLLYLTETSVVHLGGSGTKVTQRRYEQITISNWLCVLKTKGRALYLLHQVLILFNLLLDELAFRQHRLRHRSRLYDLRQKILRRISWQLWRRYTLKIFLQFSPKPSSSGRMLIYTPPKNTSGRSKN